MTPAELLKHYINRVASTADMHALKSVRWRGIGALHALHASGLLTDAENADALNLFVDACSARHAELAAAPEDSEGDAQ